MDIKLVRGLIKIPTSLIKSSNLRERVRVVDEMPLSLRGKSAAFDEGPAEAEKMNDSTGVSSYSSLRCPALPA